LGCPETPCESNVMILIVGRGERGIHNGIDDTHSLNVKVFDEGLNSSRDIIRVPGCSEVVL
jgi:hypothetical protein